jgi:hypothetical protein
MRRWLAVFGLAGAIGVPSLGFQEPVTLTLKAGGKLAGDLVDLGAAGFTLRVGGEDRTIARGDVVVIDFGSGAVRRPAELDDLRGDHLAVLRDGSIVMGEFADVGGTRPLRLTFNTRSGARDLSSADVRRIYLSRPEESGGRGEATPTPAPAPPPGSRTFRVSATEAWTATGISVTRGQWVRFASTGEVQVGDGLAAMPAGNPNNIFDGEAPLPSVLLGALIGRIDVTTPVGRASSAGREIFAVGNQDRIPMPASGMLYLGVNDSRLQNNRGAFQVSVTVERVR